MSVTISKLEDKKDLIKSLYCKNSSDQEFELFMHACVRSGLDPMMRQIYAIKRGNQITIQTGIDGFRLIGERTGNYSPGRESTYELDENKRLVAATSYIKKRTSDGVWHEISATAYWSEYCADGPMWKKMPRTMLAKCAEALALRKAFPMELSGLYTKDEMDQAGKNMEDADFEFGQPILAIQEPKKEELSEEQSAQLDFLLMEVDDNEYLRKITEFFDVDDIHKVHPRHYDMIIRRIEKKLKEGANEAQRMA